MTRDIVLLTLLFVGIVSLLIYFRRREARLLKKKVIDSMSPELRAEIEEERRTNLERKRKFEEALKRADDTTPQTKGY